MAAVVALALSGDAHARQPTPDGRPGAGERARATRATTVRVALAPNGRINIVVFLDPQGPFDARLYSTLKQLIELYPSTVSIDYQYFPLPMHRNAELAAEALIAARAQGRSVAMMDLVFANQTALERADLDRYATQAGLDLDRFKTAMDTHAGRAAVESSLDLGRHSGVVGTPLTLLNDRKLVGNQSLEDLKALVDADLSARAAKVASRAAAEKAQAEEAARKTRISFAGLWTGAAVLATGIYDCKSDTPRVALFQISQEGRTLRAKTVDPNACVPASSLVWEGQLSQDVVTGGDLPTSIDVQVYAAAKSGKRKKIPKTLTLTIDAPGDMNLPDFDFPLSRGDQRKRFSDNLAAFLSERKTKPRPVDLGRVGLNLEAYEASMREVRARQESERRFNETQDIYQRQNEYDRGDCYECGSVRPEVPVGEPQ
jgi:protein-disulfide isomerase